MWTGGVKDAMLSPIVPEVTQIRQNCQKGVMECNRERFEGEDASDTNSCLLQATELNKGG